MSPASPWLALTLHVGSAQAESFSTLLFELGCQGTQTLEETARGCRLLAHFPPGTDQLQLLEQLQRRWGQWQRGRGESWRLLDAQWQIPADWSVEWRKGYRPIRVGQQFLILPSWWPPPKVLPPIVLRLDPGNAFGSGTHATTRLCLLGLAVVCRPGMSAVDVGTGSGILAIAMARLQSPSAGRRSPERRILAFDPDPDALRAARSNARRNGVKAQILFRTAGLEQLVPRPCELVVANLTTPHLLQEAERLVAWCRPGGRLLLSGLEVRDARQVQQRYRRLGCRAEKCWRREGWSLIVLRRHC